MAKKSLLVLFLFLLVVFPLVSAVPPTNTIITFDNGYIIGISPEGFIKQNQNYQLNFFVYNKSNGIQIVNTTVSCQFYLANSTGNVLVYQNVTYFAQGYWGINILGSNFSYPEVFPYGIKCGDGIYGGTTISYFEVTGTGYELTPARATTYIIIFFILMFLFVVVMLGINKLPSGNDTDESGKLMSINNLKYFRSVLLLLEYLLVVGIFYLSSNLAFSYLGEQLFAKILFMFFQVLAWLILPIIIVWVVWIFAQIIDDKRMRRLIEHGIYEGKGGNW